MLTKEAQKKRWQWVNYSSKKPHGQSVLAVTVKLPDETVEEIKTADEVFRTMSSHLSARFRLAFTSPMCSGKIFDDIGFL